MQKNTEETNQISSIFVNISQIERITVSKIKMNVKFFTKKFIIYQIDFDEYSNNSIEKILENEKTKIEKDQILKNLNHKDDESEIFQKGYIVYDKLSKL